jgi:DNA topoisomerase-1
VESPTKAKTIRKFLGREYVVESCMGHIRDLPESAKEIPEKFKKEKWAKLGVDVDHHFVPIYCIPKRKQKVVDTLKKLVKEASIVYLATDEDREGESISWHLAEVLNPNVPIKRMVFNEITRPAIDKALQNTREVDMNLVKAQEARRILDRLVGYTISPLLWKKIAFGLSAGRVQSVALRLIVEREEARLRFKTATYWGLVSQLKNASDPVQFSSQLFSLKGQRVAIGKDFDGLTGELKKDQSVIVLGETEAKKLKEDLSQKSFKVTSVEEKPTFRKPAAPFITSTLQQEANRKLGLSSRETMQVAQKLYEEGFITYMRTDSTFLSSEAISASRKCIQERFGKDYLPPAPRLYDAKKVKGAQEAHEAIRPSGQSFVVPEDTGLSGLQLKLYELVWMRTVASQMVDSRQKQVSVKIEAGEAVFTASGMTIEFPGFLRAYVEGADDPELELEEKETKLPALKKGDTLITQSITAQDHHTKPPARYTEASLVQILEKEGIGRPSTYASIIGTIVDRGYVRKAGNALVPTFTALVVGQMLRKHLPQYVDLKFTSEMEESLDAIALGDLDWEKYLTSLYLGKNGLRELVAAQEKQIDPDDARTAQLEGLNGFAFKVGRYGAYVQTTRDGQDFSASIPDNEAPADMTKDHALELIEQKIKGADSLGKDPKTGRAVYVLNGRYGPYVQLGEVSDEENKPKRVSLPANMPFETVKLPEALQLLSLPINLGKNPENGEDVQVGLGRFGPYVVSKGEFRSIPKGDNIFNVTLPQALELLKAPKGGRGSRRAAPVKELGLHPVAQEKIDLMNGPYGFYVKMGKVNASLPEGAKAEDINLAQAIELINAKEPASAKAKTKTKSKSPGKKKK